LSRGNALGRQRARRRIGAGSVAQFDVDDCGRRQREALEIEHHAVDLDDRRRRSDRRAGDRDEHGDREGNEPDH
jgi:hypothetical protein